MFELHAQLEKDSHLVAENDAFVLLLANDARYPWLILVPKKADIAELHQLSEQEQVALMQTSCMLGKELMQLFDGDKFNVAALGNQVPQLHVHHIVRHTTDYAWPKPIWGEGATVPYTGEGLNKRMTQLSENLSFVKDLS